MCRLAAFPPGYTEESAMKLMSQYGTYNRDGVGIAYAKAGELVIEKWPQSWESLEKSGIRPFKHMPCDGWTIAHVRAATHGEVVPANTHPFRKGDWAIVHNGIYSGHRLAKELLKELGATFEGQTDSEVGAELISRFGPKRFLRFAGGRDGTFLALNKFGELYAIVAGGACDVYEIDKKQVVIASSISNKGVKSIDRGWMRLSPSGKIRGGKYKMEKSYSYVGSTYYSRGYSHDYPPLEDYKPVNDSRWDPNKKSWTDFKKPKGSESNPSAWRGKKWSQDAGKFETEDERFERLSLEQSDIRELNLGDADGSRVIWPSD